MLVEAVFVVARTDEGLLAATTRPDEEGRVGLPGGKVEEGESLVEAVLREAHEEGWAIEGVYEIPSHVAIVEGMIVAWLDADRATMLDEYLEKGRVEPVALTAEEIAASGYGNEWLLERDQ